MTPAECLCDRANDCREHCPGCDHAVPHSPTTCGEPSRCPGAGWPVRCEPVGIPSLARRETPAQAEAKITTGAARFRRLAVPMLLVPARLAGAVLEFIARACI